MDDKVNGNRRDVHAKPDIKVGKVEPDNSNSTKNIGGGPINNENYNWKDQNRRTRRD